MSGSGFAQFVPLILIFVIFYFFLIRPQQKKVKEHKLMVSALKRGDEVITSGGIDNMEKYKYIIGQINALEATRQELSTLLDNKEQKSEGTIIDIKPNPPQT